MKYKLLFCYLFLTIPFFFVSAKETPNNKFLVSKNFKVQVRFSVTQAHVKASFYLQNVSNGGLSLLFTDNQFSELSIDHPKLAGCSNRSSGAIPIMRSFEEEKARRIAVYIPKGDGFYVTLTSICNWAEKYTGILRNGTVSGRITVIKGKRILTWPISGNF